MRISLAVIITFTLGFINSLNAQVDSIPATTDSISLINDTLPEQSDTIKKSLVIRNPNHSPKKAGMLSAILPGMGQIYNHKYWKLPIVYGAIGGAGYYAYLNTMYYNFFHDALVIANNPYHTSADLYNYALNNKNTSKVTNYTPDDISNLQEADFQTQSDYYRRYRDLSYFLVGVLYLCNVLDATVDGHLYNYNVDDNLSFQIRPTYFSTQISNLPTMGLAFRMTL